VVPGRWLPVLGGTAVSGFRACSSSRRFGGGVRVAIRHRDLRPISRLLLGCQPASAVGVVCHRRTNPLPGDRAAVSDLRADASWLEAFILKGVLLLATMPEAANRAVR